MKLAKEAVDLGLYTRRRQEMLDFWQQEVGLPFEETLPAGRGIHQLRHGMNGSVLKINHARDPLPEADPSGYRELWIAREGLDEEQRLVDPDGNRVRLVPPGTDGVTGIGLLLAVHDEDAHHRFYRDVLGLAPFGERSYRAGGSLLAFAADPDVPADAATRGSRMLGPGYRYMTVQVRDVDREHAGVLARGGLEGLPPRTLGRVARISFVRDPDGNWIELSQRASLTGSLPADGESP